MLGGTLESSHGHMPDADEGRGNKRGGEEEFPSEGGNRHDPSGPGPTHPMQPVPYHRQRPACRPCQKSKIYCSRNTPCSSCRRKGIDCVVQQQGQQQAEELAEQQQQASGAAQQGPACLPCRKVKVYCDRTAPSCSRCRRKAIECVPQLRGRGRPPGHRPSISSISGLNGNSSTASKLLGPRAGSAGGSPASSSPLPMTAGPSSYVLLPPGSAAASSSSSSADPWQPYGHKPSPDGHAPHPAKRHHPYLKPGEEPEPCCSAHEEGSASAAAAAARGGAAAASTPWAVLASAGTARWLGHHGVGQHGGEGEGEEEGEEGCCPDGCGGAPSACLSELGPECSLLLALRTPYHHPPAHDGHSSGVVSATDDHGETEETARELTRKEEDQHKHGNSVKQSSVTQVYQI